MGYYKKIHIKDLVLWEVNPRISTDGTSYKVEKEAVSTYFKKNEGQMRRLASDIAENGLSPHDLVVVLPTDDDKYKVFEGNRRVSAIKSLSRPHYLDFDSNLQKHMERLGQTHHFSKVVFCYVADNIDQAHAIVEKTHQGINSGIGRVPWGPLEKDAFKRMTSDPNLTLSSKLIHQYPGFFDDIINELKSTNVDRVLSKLVIRNIVETDKDYSGMDSIQLSLVYSILEEVKRISTESNRSIAYIFHNSDDVKNLLEEFSNRKKNEILLTATSINESVKSRSLPINIKLHHSTIYIESGDTFALCENIVDDGKFSIADVKVISHGPLSAKITSNYIFDSSNPVGDYIVQYQLPFEETVITKTCQITVGPKQLQVPTREVRFLETHFPFTIDINPALNELINQLIILDTRKFNLVTAGCLRSLIDISVRMVNKKLGLSYDSSLESVISGFKNHMRNVKPHRDLISDSIPMSRDEVLNFVLSIDPELLSRKLNLITHNPGSYMSKEDLFDLANKTISYILVFITILLKSA